MRLRRPHKLQVLLYSSVPDIKRNFAIAVVIIPIVEAHQVIWRSQISRWLLMA
jgi:hypothetical protein